ncbi:hypothetical protein KKB64_02440 [Patescibacteria group bacterium]|nr:hypothetical protein [Patescibacteria group bacterium]MBU2460140.1 hypothetical protein [Patescibacteria group bacterium]MBU2544435.1 hypothetical protein [Patescibacteria group bacterium]
MPKKSGSKEVVEETDTEYVTRKIEEYCQRLRDDLKQELDASIQPMEGPYEDRLHAFITHLDQLTQKDGRKGTRWMSLIEIYSNVRFYGRDAVVLAATADRVTFGVM